MKINISNPATGLQKCIEIDNEEKLAIFYGKKMGQEVEADALGDEFKGYILKITGGNDKQGFTMKQGVLVQGRVRLLMGAGHKNYRPRRTGERKRKSVRGCIAGPDLSAIAVAVVKTGEQAIAGLTDSEVAKRRGPKRAANIRKLFKVSKKEDIRKFVVLYRRKFENKEGKTRTKCPKIQRLVTENRVLRKKIQKREKQERFADSKKQRDAYHKLIEKVRAEKKAALLKKRREEKAAAEAVKTEAPKKAAPTKAAPTKAAAKTAAPAKTTKKGKN